MLRHAALVGDRTHFTRQDTVEASWRIVQPLLDSPPPVHEYEKGSWGAPKADQLVAGFGGWRGPWLPQSAPEASRSGNARPRGAEKRARNVRR